MEFGSSNRFPTVSTFIDLWVFEWGEGTFFFSLIYLVKKIKIKMHKRVQTHLSHTTGAGQPESPDLCVLPPPRAHRTHGPVPWPFSPTEMPPNVPFPRPRPRQWVLPTRVKLTRPSVGRVTRGHTRPVASGSRPADEGSRRCQHLFKLPCRKTSSPRAPAQLNKGPPTPGSFVGREMRNQSILQIVLVGIIS